MIKSFVSQELVLSEEEREKLYWDDLNFNSHRWVEYNKGYYKCSFCHNTHTSTMPTSQVSFCELNPYIKTTKMKL